MSGRPRAATEASQCVTRADYVEAVVIAVSILLISLGFVLGSWSPIPDARTGFESRPPRFTRASPHRAQGSLADARLREGGLPGPTSI
jgi:hypothetical protein